MRALGLEGVNNNQGNVADIIRADRAYFALMAVSAITYQAYIKHDNQIWHKEIQKEKCKIR